MKINEFIDKYNTPELADNIFLEEHTESLTGRVMAIRSQSNKLLFIKLVGDEAKVQIMLNLANY
jgi:lysyl-tRNA synthetase class II